MLSVEERAVLQSRVTNSLQAATVVDFSTVLAGIIIEVVEEIDRLRHQLKEGDDVQLSRESQLRQA
jgi:hypothetical protein